MRRGQASALSMTWKKPQGIGYDGVEKLIAAGVADGLNAIGLLTVNHIKSSIQRGPKSGHVYHRISEGGTTFVRKGAADGPIVAAFRTKEGPTGIAPTHQSSAPGQYPATDTGRLVGSIGYDVETGDAFRPAVTIFANAEYAIPLEMKPSSKGGRPFMSRGVNEMAPRYGKVLDAAINARVRGTFAGPWQPESE